MLLRAEITTLDLNLVVRVDFIVIHDLHICRLHCNFSWKLTSDPHSPTEKNAPAPGTFTFHLPLVELPWKDSMFSQYKWMWGEPSRSLVSDVFPLYSKTKSYYCAADNVSPVSVKTLVIAKCQLNSLCCPQHNFRHLLALDSCPPFFLTVLPKTSHHFYSWPYSVSDVTGVKLPPSSLWCFMTKTWKASML